MGKLSVCNRNGDKCQGVVAKNATLCKLGAPLVTRDRAFIRRSAPGRLPMEQNFDRPLRSTHRVRQEATDLR